MRFGKGLLYARYNSGEGITELFYTMADIGDATRGFDTVSLALISPTIACPHVRDNIELFQHGDLTTMGGEITFKILSSDQIREMYKKWRSKISIPGWLSRVSECYGLDEGELARLNRLAQEFI